MELKARLLRYVIDKGLLKLASPLLPMPLLYSVQYILSGVLSSLWTSWDDSTELDVMEKREKSGVRLQNCVTARQWR
jgi:hypothetical protein